MNFVDKILPDILIHSLGWTIIHSLWQGALIALLLFAFIMLVKSSAAVKEKISILALGLIVLSFITTFTIEITNYQEKAETIAYRGAVVNDNNILQDESAGDLNLDDNPVLQTSVVYQVRDFLIQNISFLSFLWLTGFIFFVTRFLGGIYLTKKIKYEGTSFVPASWQNKVNSLSYKLNLYKPVRILESIKVSVPIVIGYVKPVLLMPAGMLSGLPQSQIEAIIAHELAHIYRNDYLLNIIQSLGETILFYHPAAWWISHKIRTERENSCDDMAVSICADKITFARALANLEEVKMKNRQFALAIKNNGSLSARIKRLLGANQNSITFPEKIFSLIIIAALLMSATVFASASFKPVKRTIAGTKYFTAVDSSWKKGKYNFVNDNIKVKLNNGNIEELFINGKRIPENKFSDYKEMVATTLDTLNIDFPELPPSPELADLPPYPVKAPKPVLASTTELPEPPPLPGVEPKAVVAKLPPPPPAPKISIEPVLPDSLEDLKLIKEEKLHLEKLQRTMEKEKEYIKQIEEKMKIKELELRKKSKELKIKSEELKRKNEMFLDKLTSVLVKNDIVTADEKYSIKFSNKELIINGKKQSEELLIKTKGIYKSVWGNDMSDNATFEINN
ncbi:MAG TPA: M56 family metallopeptidase [Ignavibacteriaceae bacterium]|nr:M56 family metallopeptidase [Ignavibacteriaceae bacterium]